MPLYRIYNGLATMGHILQIINKWKCETSLIREIFKLKKTHKIISIFLYQNLLFVKYFNKLLLLFERKKNVAQRKKVGIFTYLDIFT